MYRVFIVTDYRSIENRELVISRSRQRSIRASSSSTLSRFGHFNETQFVLREFPVKSDNAIDLGAPWSFRDVCDFFFLYARAHARMCIHREIIKADESVLLCCFRKKKK